MKPSVLWVCIITVIVVFTGCVATTTSTTSTLWSQAQANGQNQIFSATVNGKVQKCVWVAAIGHPEHKARHQAHKKGIQILGSRSYDVDVKVVHRSDGQCRIDMLMTTP